MTIAEAQKEVDELSSKLHHYNYLYYQESKSEVSDYEFDQMMKKLIELEKEFPELSKEDSPSKRVGGTITKNFETVVHKYRMMSLGNTYSPDELRDFDKRIIKSLGDEPYEYFCELKFDGVAISLTYENGVLKQAVTRGDGTQGDNITANAKTIRTIPLSLKNGDFPNEFEVRGEVFMPLTAFQELNAERASAGEELLANPRNTASGTLKMQDSSVVASRKLDCYLYSLMGADLDIASHADSIRALESWGFNISKTYAKCATIEDVIKYVEEWEEKRKELPLETDGIVIKVNSTQHQKVLGFTSKNPRWAISFKYKAESATTLLKSITYQVGRTGAITPVAELAPVSLAGTTVKRASLYNANEIERLDLRVGDTVMVEKGGEIIPKVMGVDLDARSGASEPVRYITNCLECDTELIRHEGEVVHYCPNINGCPPQIKGRIEHFIHRKAMNIDSMGEQTIRLLFDQGLLNDPSDLYRLTFGQVIELEGFKELSTKNLLQGIEDSKKTPFAQVLFAMGIRFVGRTVAEKLTAYFKNIDALSKATFEELIEVPEIGDRIANSLINYFQDADSMVVLERLKSSGLQFVTEESTENLDSDVLSGHSFVVSGVFKNYSREDIKSAIKSNGGKIVSSISGKLDYLVAGDKMGPAKLQKAEKLGIKIISEDEFENLLK